MTFAPHWFPSSLLDHTEVLSPRRPMLRAQMHPGSHLSLIFPEDLFSGVNFSCVQGFI